MPVTNLLEFKRRKGLERLAEAGDAIQASRDTLFSNFRDWFEVPEDEDIQFAVDVMFDRACAEFLQARTLSDCINGQVALESFYAQFHPIITKPCPWLDMAVGVEQ